ncbi:hypothetical protein DPEC_G00278220 [Dallia pectoralis]|uniref:Uncharacterized protein n=1 Tax=Dallia pectoralis TaxID=75939 RepID=A0ACC2FM26_DALPE|nr:hypothetical protein DPEC_G00278220 [Dallia pectoralis]
MIEQSSSLDLELDQSHALVMYSQFRLAFCSQTPRRLAAPVSPLKIFKRPSVLSETAGIPGPPSDKLTCRVSDDLQRRVSQTGRRREYQGELINIDSERRKQEERTVASLSALQSGGIGVSEPLASAGMLYNT